MEILCGMDVHDRSIVCFIGQGKEKPVKAVYRNDESGREALVKRLRDEQKKVQASGIYAVYEASGFGFNLCDELQEAGIRCSVLAPTEIAYTATSRKKKNDSRDALDLYEILRGHVLADNRLPDVWQPDKELRDDRQLVRSLLDVKEKAVKVKIQVQTLLKQHGLKRPQGVENWTLAHRDWLCGLAVNRGVRFSLDSLLRQLSFLEDEIKHFEKEVKILSLSSRYRERNEALQRIKGVGLITAMVFLTELGMMSRFANRKQIGSYLGLTPGCHESGEADDRKGRITGAGPSRIRYVLNQAYHTYRRFDEHEQKVYDRIVEKNPKRKNKAVVAGMRRLGVLMWHIGYCVEKGGVLVKEAA